MSDYVMRGTHNGRSITLELIFHGKDTIMKTGSRRFCDFSVAVHLMKEGGNGPD